MPLQPDATDSAPESAVKSLPDSQASSRSPTLMLSVRRNAVALISLSIAIFSTSYNTWRNQTTEAHRNVREASFKLLEQSGELAQIAQRRYYGGDHSDMNWIDGWGKAALIRNISAITSPTVQNRAESVFSTWETESANLASGEGDSVEHITQSLDALNLEIGMELQRLR